VIFSNSKAKYYGASLQKDIINCPSLDLKISGTAARINIETSFV